MNEQLLTKDISEVLSAVHYRPSISILMPFGEKGDLRQNLVQSLDLAADKVERELNSQYPKELVNPLMKRLRLIIEKLDIDQKKKSIAIFLSPVFEKVVFLDIAVEEKVIIDESFEIRDLVYSRKQINKYLVLLLSSRESRIFLGNAHDFARIKLDIPEWAGAYRNDAPERVANFSDTKERKAVLRDKFLHQIDLALEPLLRNFKVPLFVLGTESVLGHFKKLSHHTHSVAGYIQGNYDGKSGIELRKILQPALEWYDKARQTLLMKRIDEAAGQKKLTLHLDLPEGDAFSAFVDPLLIRRAVENLLSNAIKYSPNHSTINLHLDHSPEGQIYIQVMDEGSGINAELRQHIFDRYEIGTLMRGVSQMGLGLAFCKLAVEAHGGHITVNDNQPKGSIFTITLDTITIETKEPNE